MDLGMRPEEYGRFVLNVMNTNTPRKHAARAIQQLSHSCHTLFEVEKELNIKEELGFDSGKVSIPSDDGQLVGPPTKVTHDILKL